MKSFDEFVNESLIQNIKDPGFDGSDPKAVEIHNRGVGGVRTLQGHRDQIVRILEDMLKNAKKAQKDHKMAHWHLDKVLQFADPQKLGGVLLPYLRNHQEGIEELEALRRRGGSGPGRTVPKGLI